MSLEGGRKGTMYLLQYPLLLLICIVLSAELSLYLLLRVIVALYERAVRYVDLEHAQTFDQWAKAARELDEHEDRDAWKKDNKSAYYNATAIDNTIGELREIEKDAESIVRVKDVLLERVFNKNRVCFGIHNEELYAQTHFGTKHLIEQFIRESCKATQEVFDDPYGLFSLDQKKEFFRKAIEGYGRSALCMSGGSTLGFTHFGVLKALLDVGYLPKILCGTSAGSLIVAVAGSRTDQELKEYLSPDLHKYFRTFPRGHLYQVFYFLKNGVLFDNESFYDLAKEMVFGDMTFKEAYEKTGRILNITVTNQQKHGGKILLNYLTVPDVTLWSAVVASSCIPGLLKPVTLMAKTSSGELVPHKVYGDCWSDGSFQNDIPAKQLAEDFNVSYCIVSQSNPHILPFIFYKRGSAGQPSMHLFGSRLRGGFIFSTIESFLKLDMKKWLRLVSDLDLLPSFGGSDMRQLFLQNFTGDVTVHIPFGMELLWAYSRLILEPTESAMAKYLEIGQKLTWPKLYMIQNHMILEKILLEKLDQLEQMQ